MILDTLHRQSLEKLVVQLSITGLTDADLHYLTMGWHRLNPWQDSVAGLTRLKTKYIISPLSNGNVALLTNMATQKLGLKTAFVARPTEYGPLQKYDFEARGDWDIVAKDFGGIADKMGC